MTDADLTRRFYDGQIGKLRDAITRYKQIAAREDTALGNERSIAYGRALALVDRYFPTEGLEGANNSQGENSES